MHFYDARRFLTGESGEGETKTPVLDVKVLADEPPAALRRRALRQWLSTRAREREDWKWFTCWRLRSFWRATQAAE